MTSNLVDRKLNHFRSYARFHQKEKTGLLPPTNVLVQRGKDLYKKKKVPTKT